ncbi:MAG TPA: hypothetical protein VMF56_03965 [Acidobacteriaceae bacterium]|nr:hypothetical protein [Acidobacteriaceae bacterium]
MADIKITDNFDLTADFQIRDDSPLAKAKLTQLVSAGKELFGELDKPLDQADLKSFSLGAEITSPDLISGKLVSLSIGGGANCAVSILTSTDGFVFGKDQFSPSIAIGSNEAWLGVEMDLIAKAKVSVSANAVGVSFEGDSKLTCSTFTRFSVPRLPLPSLRDACAAAFTNFSITESAAAIRGQLLGTANQTDVGGSVTAKLTLKQPYNLNALASANLPFNATASITPSVTLQISGSIIMTGEFIFRSYKKADNIVEIGVYKKRGTTLAASFTAGAGIGGDIGDDDILGALLNKALPGVDVAAAGITGDNAKALNKVIKNGIDRSLSAQLNVTCSAAFTDEAAVVYEVQLDGGDAAKTDSALTLALQADWTAIDALPNAHRIRNIVVDTAEKKSSITLNLFGIYSATSVTDYVKSCTILLDESGQVSIIDKLETSRIAAVSLPFASDSEKLRTALMQDFVATATYAVVAGKLNLHLSVMQTYLDYQRNMSRNEMTQNIKLGYQLGIIPQGSLDAVLSATQSFPHALVSATVSYATPAILAMYFSDTGALKPRTQDELEQIGRDTMRAFLNPSDPVDAARIAVLSNSAAWVAMDESGDTATFGQILELQHLNQVQLAVVGSDWVSIRWWADVFTKVAPALRDTMAALAKAPAANPAQDPDFIKQRARLANALGAVTRKTNAAFVHGWGEAVIFALSGKAGTAAMDISWSGFKKHYGQP